MPIARASIERHLPFNHLKQARVLQGFRALPGQATAAQFENSIRHRPCVMLSPSATSARTTCLFLFAAAFTAVVVAGGGRRRRRLRRRNILNQFYFCVIPSIQLVSLHVMPAPTRSQEQQDFTVSSDSDDDEFGSLSNVATLRKVCHIPAMHEA